MPKEDHYLKTKLVNNQTSIAFFLSVHYIMFYQIYINCLSFRCFAGNVYLLFSNCVQEIDLTERNRLGKQKMLHLIFPHFYVSLPSNDKCTSGLQNC